jgi:hypothetical protein
MLAACGSPQTPPVAASADAIDEAVNNAERELAAAKGGSAQSEKGGLFGA